MASNKILINGSFIDKKFFEENVTEAKKYFWLEKPASVISDHRHCIICMMALPNAQNSNVFVSDNLLLCNHCWANYLSQDGLQRENTD